MLQYFDILVVFHQDREINVITSSCYSPRRQIKITPRQNMNLKKQFHFKYGYFIYFIRSQLDDWCHCVEYERFGQI